jgi:hyperosmotically inducible protein
MVSRRKSLFLIFAPLAALMAQGNPADDKIYDQVRQRLANDPDVKGAGFQVTVKNGAVTIEGSVRDSRGKEKAEKIAKKVKGVTSVNNQLKITGA